MIFGESRVKSITQQIVWFLTLAGYSAIVALFRQKSAGFVPASTGKLSVGMRGMQAASYCS